MGTLLSAIIVLHGISAPVHFCEGLRIDNVTTYSSFLHENALDLDSQRKLQANQDILTAAKLRAYNQQAPNVQRGQASLCGKPSSNWVN